MEKENENQEVIVETPSEDVASLPQKLDAQPKSKAQSKSQKETGYKVVFEGEAAERLVWLESQLRERSAKPEMGQILGKEILSFEDQRWAAIIEENTEMDYFFSQIRRIKDKPKALKLLKGLSEKLLKENEGALEEGFPNAFPSGDGNLLANTKASRKKAPKLDDQTSGNLSPNETN